MTCLIAPTLLLLTIVLGSVAAALAYDELVDYLGFDRRHGIETGTFSPVRLRHIRVPVHAGYMASRVRSMRSLFETLPIAPARFTLVDLGSGKARALLVGAEAGFARCVGVESNPVLVRASHRNLAAWRSRTNVPMPIDILRGDAGSFAFPPGPLVVFMYNPFGADTMRRVIENLERAYRAAPRPIFVVMRHPRFTGIVARSGFLKPLALRNATTDFHAVFATTP